MYFGRLYIIKWSFENNPSRTLRLACRHGFGPSLCKDQRWELQCWPWRLRLPLKSIFNTGMISRIYLVTKYDITSIQNKLQTLKFPKLICRIPHITDAFLLLIYLLFILFFYNIFYYLFVIICIIITWHAIIYYYYYYYIHERREKQSFGSKASILFL